MDVDQPRPAVTHPEIDDVAHFDLVEVVEKELHLPAVSRPVGRTHHGAVGDLAELALEHLAGRLGDDERRGVVDVGRERLVDLALVRRYPVVGSDPPPREFSLALVVSIEHPDVLGRDRDAVDEAEPGGTPREREGRERREDRPSVHCLAGPAASPEYFSPDDGSKPLWGRRHTTRVMELATFLVATLTAHVGFAACVVVHGYATDRDVGRWPLLTLAFGLAGIAGYLFYDPDEAA